MLHHKLHREFFRCSSSADIILWLVITPSSPLRSGLFIYPERTRGSFFSFCCQLVTHTLFYWQRVFLSSNLIFNATLIHSTTTGGFTAHTKHGLREDKSKFAVPEEGHLCRVRGAFRARYFRCTCELRGCDRREERDQNEISWPRRAIFIEAARALVDGWIYLLNAERQEEEYARRLFHYLSLFSSTYYFVRRSLTFTMQSHVVHSCTVMGPASEDRLLGTITISLLFASKCTREPQLESTESNSIRWYLLALIYSNARVARVVAAV